MYILSLAVAANNVTPRRLRSNSVIVNQSSQFQVRIEAHRGAGHLEPENSLKAFTRAVQLGITGVETDVWLTKDQVPVIVHGLLGGVVVFQNGIRKKIGVINSADLHTYTLHNGEKIPTLAQVLDICKDKLHLNIEIKDTREEVIEKTLDVVEQKDMLSQVTFSSFNHYLRKKLTDVVEKRGIEAPLSFGFLVKEFDRKFPDYSETQPGDSINVDVKLLQLEREQCLEEFRKAHENDVKLGFWFPIEYADEKIYYEDLLKLKADTIITNRPIELVQYLTM